MARASADDDTQDWDQSEFWRRQARVATGEPADDTWPHPGAAPPIRRSGRAMSAALLLLLVAGAVGLAVTFGRSGPAAVPLPPVQTTPSFGSDDPTATPPATVSADASPTPSAIAGSSAPSSPKPTVRPAPRPTITPGPAPAVVTPRSSLVVRIVSVASGKPFGVARAADGAPIIQVSPAASDAQLWRLQPSAAGCFNIVNLASLKALDNPDGTTDDGVPLQQSALTVGDPDQSWCFDPHGSAQFLIRNVANGFAVDLRDGDGSDGAAIQQWSADLGDPNENQRWRLTLP